MLDNKTFKKYIKNFYESMPEKNSHRYKSWEYCYKFFYDNRKQLIDKQPQTIDLAALHLAFYLASWGMYRGSSFLLQMDYTVHKKAVEIISTYYELADISIENWKEKDTNTLFELNHSLEDHYKNAKKEVAKQAENNKENVSDTLITKILLGTLGITPAYDRYFKNGLKLYNDIYTSEEIPTSFSYSNFNKLINFIKKYESQINKLDLKLKIDTKQQYPYPLMKKVDMFFWNLGRPWAIWNGNEYIIENKKQIGENNQYVNYLPKNGELDRFESHIKLLNNEI
ncbi:MAG: hypothetical protein MR368_04335 [Azospirillum sp.]|nr:hypothetical protein [Azospirillum sp.]